MSAWFDQISAYFSRNSHERSEDVHMRAFNVTGLCLPEEDYMVDISGKIKQIKELVDSRRYFTINRARQYVKTTTLEMLKRELRNEFWLQKLAWLQLKEV